MTTTTKKCSKCKTIKSLDLFFMRASTDLRNWLAFLTLREAKGAQYEIRQYAHAVSRLIAECFPRTHALYAEGKA